MEQLLRNGGAGQAILFMSALLGTGMAALIWVTYASHCFLTVLTESTVGGAEVRWPDESIVDWWWKPLYCAGMLAFWATLAGVVCGLLALVSPWLFGVAAGLFLWYGFPVGLLCAMDAGTPMAVVHVPLFLRLFTHLPVVLLVGLMTLPPMAVAVGCIALVMVHSLYWVLPAALLLPPALFFYSRCWGRLAWLLLNLKSRTAKPEAPPPEAAHARSHDPWAPPEEEVPEMDVAVDEPPPAQCADDDDEEWAKNPAPYVMSAQASSTPRGSGHEADTGSAQFNHAKYYDEYRKRDELRRARAEGRTPGEKKRRSRASFRTAFGKDLLPFFLHWRTSRASTNLAVATVFFVVLLRIAIATLP